MAARDHFVNSGRVVSEALNVEKGGQSTRFTAIVLSSIVGIAFFGLINLLERRFVVTGREA